MTDKSYEECRCAPNSLTAEELEVVSAVAEKLEACCCATDSLTTEETEDLDVVEVASAVEEELEAACRL